MQPCFSLPETQPQLFYLLDSLHISLIDIFPIIINGFILCCVLFIPSRHCPTAMFTKKNIEALPAVQCWSDCERTGVI